ncbi:putative methyltransferase PMT15 [Fagus crenata]
MACLNPLCYLLPFKTKRANLSYLTFVSFLCLLCYLYGIWSNSYTLVLSHVPCPQSHPNIATSTDVRLDFLPHHRAPDPTTLGDSFELIRSMRRHILREHAMRRHGKVHDLDLEV